MHAAKVESSSRFLTLERSKGSPAHCTDTCRSRRSSSESSSSESTSTFTSSLGPNASDHCVLNRDVQYQENSGKKNTGDERAVVENYGEPVSRTCPISARSMQTDLQSISASSLLEAAKIAAKSSKNSKLRNASGPRKTNARDITNDKRIKSYIRDTSHSIGISRSAHQSHRTTVPSISEASNCLKERQHITKGANGSDGRLKVSPNSQLLDKLWPKMADETSAYKCITSEMLNTKQNIVETEITQLLQSSACLIAITRQEQQLEIRKLRNGLRNLVKHCGKLSTLIQMQAQKLQSESSIETFRQSDTNQLAESVDSEMSGDGNCESDIRSDTFSADESFATSVDNMMKQATEQIESKWKDRFDKIQAEHTKALENERRRAVESMNSSTRQQSDLIHEKDNEIKILKEKYTSLEMHKRKIEIDLETAHKELNIVRSHLQAFDDDLTTNASTFWQKTTDLAKLNRTLTEELNQTHQTLSMLRERMEIVRHDNKDLRQQIEICVSRIQGLETSCSLAQETCAAMKQNFENEKTRREQFQVSVEQLTVENTALYAQLVAVQTTHEAKMEQLRLVQEQKQEASISEMKQLRNENHLLAQTKVLAHNLANDVYVDKKIKCLRESSAVNVRLEEMMMELSYQRDALALKCEEIASLKNQVLDGELTQRKLRNTIQELRGNIRVHVRLRPFLPSDRDFDGQNESTAPAILCDTFGQSISIAGDKRFAFDKVYGQSASQDNVFKDVADFIQSAVDGYNVCIFAYGQTGSGKTHTMQGSGKQQMRGIIPRSIDHIIHHCRDLATQGWTYSLRVQYFEIYNETIKDLLVSSQCGAADKKYQIRTNRRGKNYVEGLVTKNIDMDLAREQLEDIVKLAACNRSVEKTDMNASSSRSHSIFLLMIHGTNSSQVTEVQGSLSLVDLAGSERISRSNVTGDRLKEAQAINKSLSSLADVFQALAKKAPHIPYRNSKLTYVLQPSLSADGKTLMMVNLSPTSASVEESLCSLRFAQQVNQCELGAPVRQIQAKPNSLPHSKSLDGSRMDSSRALVKANVATVPRSKTLTAKRVQKAA